PAPRMWMAVVRRNRPSRIVRFRSSPRITRFGVVTSTCSRYTPGETRISVPGAAVSTASWMVGASWGTRMIVGAAAVADGAIASGAPTASVTASTHHDRRRTATSARRKCDGQRAGPVGPEHRHRLASVAVGETRRRDPVEEHIQGDAAFEPGERRARADVRAAPERQVIAGVRAVEAERVRILIYVRVTVGRGEAERDLGTARDRTAFDGD